MPKDYRTQFIQSVEAAIIPVIGDRDLSDRVIREVTKALGDYEITERSTEVAIIDSTNERILKRYCACLLIDGKSEKTIMQYKRSAEKLADALHKNYPDMGVYDIRYFLACEKDRGVSNRTLENTRSNISAFFQWLTLEELIPKNPCLNIKPIKFQDKIRYPFSPVEIDGIRSACKNLKERAIVEVLLSSGIRVSELTALEKADIDFSALTLRVRHGKGDKERVTYITEVARLHLQKYMLARKDDGPLIFYNNRGERLLPNGVRFILKELERRSDIQNIHPHRFRRTFATGLASRGMDIQEIRILLGHSNINTTLEYVCTDEEKVGRSYKQFIA